MCQFLRSPLACWFACGEWFRGSGLGPSHLNHRLVRTPLRRYDLCWPSVRVIVEYDGRHHIEREEQWEADLDRREADDDEGWRTLIVTGRGIYREPERTVNRVWRVLKARHLRAVPDRPRDDWRPHFPS